MIDPKSVATAHDQMADEYDELQDLWYPWLFAQIHEFIATRLPRQTRPMQALDVGCGTGFQSFLLAQAGFEVTGFDLAERLLDVARSKTSACSRTPFASQPLFSGLDTDGWLASHHRRLAQLLESVRAGKPVKVPTFVRGDATDYPYGISESDVIVCCGSVLSFVDRYAEVLERMSASLRPGGRMFLELEQKRNLDLVWPFVDRALGGVLEYDQTWVEARDNLLSRPGQSVRVDYPFELHTGEHVVLPIWLFSVRELEGIFRRCRLRITGRLGVHQVTNLIPSTLLHASSPGRIIRRLFGPLRRLDGSVGTAWPFWRLGCSVVYCLERA